MVTIHTGDLFRSTQPALVCPANSVGTLGAGLARAFRDRFPQCVGPYTEMCDAGWLIPSRPCVVRDPVSGRYVVYVPTKRHWRESSSLARVRECARGLRWWLDQGGVTGVAVPALGCGLGGLLWADVRPILQAELEGAVCVVELYEPSKSPRSK